MEKWKFLYLSVLAIGFVIGRAISPVIGVAFIWISILLAEIISYWREIKKLEQET